jgi:ubiquinone/menaquinone biosynthesis C-methylase UbiE
MTTTSISQNPDLASRLVNTVLGIRPLASFAKNRARKMMIQRAENLGISWRKQVETLQALDWQDHLAAVQDPNLSYPDYYCTSFHAYELGNLSWQAAWEVEVAAKAVHSKLWEEVDVNGDARLRKSYHDLLCQLPLQPKQILDLGCGVGMSTEALQGVYPNAEVTGVDLSPYFLAVARQRTQKLTKALTWKHAGAESTGLPAQSMDLVSAFLMFHELPQRPSRQIFTEARRLLRPGGYFAMMDMNPGSEVYRRMPTYILTLLKSTEPYLDEYFNFDIVQELKKAGFGQPAIHYNSARHRTIIAQVPEG